MIRIPLKLNGEVIHWPVDERLLSENSFYRWICAKAPRLPVEPPLPIPESPSEFLRRVRAE